MTPEQAAVTGLRDCDMIMKGGITSGVVYPSTAVALSATYRFRRLGGASAGAIAATVVAAAELGRSAPDGGFPALAGVAKELGSGLASMFQPTKRTAPAFDMLLKATSAGDSRSAKAKAIAWRAIRAKSLWFIACVALLDLPIAALGLARHRRWDAANWWAAAILTTIWALVAIALSCVVAVVLCLRSVARALPEVGFGLCTGGASDGPSDPTKPPLTDWIEERIQRVAGKPVGADLVTFGDLWGREATKAYVTATTDKAGERTADGQLNPTTRRRLRREREIDLVVMTTDLTHRRAIRFPFDSHELHWCPSCLAPYFSSRVLEHLRTHALPTDSALVAQVGGFCPVHPAQEILALPPVDKLPIVLAARLSLSFPGLLSAVPLLQVDFSRAPAKRRFERTWFSDGGIASNFPTHLFDEAFPTRPTFGIALTGMHPDYPGLVWVPEADKSGSGLHLPAVPIVSVGGFVHAVVDVMQNWSDNAQMIMPGFRDRIVRVRLAPDEGGMNLLMPKETIDRLVDRGAEAGTALAGEFDLRRHQRTRFRGSMASLHTWLDGARGALDSDYLTLVADTAWAHQLSSGSTAKEIAASGELKGLAEAWKDEDHVTVSGTIPRPTAELRSVPRQ